MLLTNGCSFVWGDELEGFDDIPASHHELTFTSLLAKSMSIPYINLATCGACNQKIFRDTINFLTRDSDASNITHMVILWSAWARDEVAENHTIGYEDEVNIQRFQCMTQISPSRLNMCKPQLLACLDEYYDHYDVTRTGIMRTLSYMQTMQLLCDSMGIKFIQGVFHRRMWEQLLNSTKPKYTKTNAPWTKWIDHVFESLDGLRDECRVGLGRYIDLYGLALEKHTIKPHAHPDEAAHEEYADLLLHIFETKCGFGGVVEEL